MLQLAPVLSQYNVLLPAGMLAGSIVDAIFPGLPLVNVPFLGVGIDGNTVIVSYLQGSLLNPLIVSIVLIQYT